MKIKVGDYVRILIIGMDGYYTVDEINDNEYTLSQPYSGMSTKGHYSGKSSYKHTLKLPLEKIEKI